MTTELPTADQELHMQTATERCFGTRDVPDTRETCFSTRDVLRHTRRASARETCSGTRDVLRHERRAPTHETCFGTQKATRQRRDHGRLRNGRDSGV